MATFTFRVPDRLAGRFSSAQMRSWLGFFSSAACAASRSRIGGRANLSDFAYSRGEESDRPPPLFVQFVPQTHRDGAAGEFCLNRSIIVGEPKYASAHVV